MTEAAALSTLDRPALLDALEARDFDCVVIGGGITGAGVAREAARRGLSVALLEADDYASGTSSRSSKLIHGGLRYLAQGEVSLVRETALERKQVRRMAPHLAEPGWMVMPTRSRASMLKFRAAVAAYEKLGAVDEADLHRNWGAKELATGEPLLRRDRYPHAIVYREYLTDDARLVLANLRAAATAGAVILNHAPVVSIGAEDGRARHVQVRCAQSGRELRVRARCVINAAGPWVEAVQRLEQSTARPMLHLSKGVHLVFARERLPVNHFLVMGTRDKRAIFAIPRGDVVYVGTTDTSHVGEPERWPEVELADVDYLLAPLQHHLDTEPLRPEECLAVWAGLRPLVAQDGKAPTEISRRDEISIGPAGVVTVAGGKLTGYRKMAQVVLARAGEVLGGALPAAAEDDAPLPGGDFDGDLDGLARALGREHGIEAQASARLVRLYGAEADAVARRGSAPLVAGGSVLQGEVSWAVQVEGAVTLVDLVDRRLRATLYLPLELDALIEPAAEAMAAALGWDRGRVRHEIAELRGLRAAGLGFRAAPDVAVLAESG